MPNKPKSTDTPSADSAGTYSRSGNNATNGEPKAENRFAEVQRRSREARARLVDASNARAADADRRIDNDRREAAERDRQLASEEKLERDGRFDRDTRAAFNTAHEHTTPHAERPGQPQSAVAKASAQLDAVVSDADESE